jgi:hypothetical protein
MIADRWPDGCAWAMAWETRQGHAYDEEAFRYLAALEWLRSQRARRPWVLLLVELSPRPAATGRLGPTGARRLFPALAGCVRETDIIGWYRRPRVAGVVLTELGHVSAADTARLVAARIARTLDTRLPVTVAHHVALRLYRRSRLTAKSDQMLGEH